MSFEPATTALLLCDMQNDFVHPDGAYARGGIRSEAIAATVPRLAAVAKAARRAGILVVTTHFTLVHGRDGEPHVSAHLRKLRPFLRRGDFASGAWGHDTLDDLKPSEGEPCNIPVEKVAYDAFHQSRLEWVLRHEGIAHLVVGGIVTNGGVASTVRGAQVREFGCTLLGDGCATIDPSLHDVNVAALRSVATVSTCAEVAAGFDALAARG